MVTNVIAETITPSGAEEETELETESEETKEDEDDVVVPPLEEKPTEEEVKEANKKSISTEPEEEVPEETPETEIPETVPKQPNPVEGETDRERGLRLEIQKLREKVRNKEELLKITPPPMDNKEYEALKEIYTDDELEKVEKLFDVIGKKKGYVRTEEIYAKEGQTTWESFEKQHPEYKPENDPEDVRWNAFKTIIDRDYKREGKSPQELARIFQKVHADVQELFGEVKTTIAPKRNAELQKVRSVSHTGGTQTEVSKKSNAPTDPKVRAMFKDFNDEDF